MPNLFFYSHNCRFLWNIWIYTRTLVFWFFLATVNAHSFRQNLKICKTVNVSLFATHGIIFRIDWDSRVCIKNSIDQTLRSLFFNVLKFRDWLNSKQISFEIIYASHKVTMTTGMTILWFWTFRRYISY